MTDRSDEREAAREQRNARLKDRQKSDARTRKTVITALMSTLEGRRYVWCELEEACVFSQTFSSAHGGYAITAFNEGKRSTGLRLLADVTRYAPQQYMQMTVENAPVQLEDRIDDGRSDDAE